MTSGCAEWCAYIALIGVLSNVIIRRCLIWAKLCIHKVINIMGLGIPGLLHKAFMPGDPKMAPQTLGELSSQTAKEGEPRPIVYGIGRPIGGNIMYMSQPIRKMVKTYVGEAGGKGGRQEKEAISGR